MFKLAVNDFRRDFFNKSNYIVLLLIVIFSIFIALVFNTGISMTEPNYDSNWEVQTSEHIKKLEEEIQNISDGKEDESISLTEEITIAAYLDEIDRLQYHLEENIPSVKQNNVYESIVTLTGFTILIALIGIVIGSRSIAEEFYIGTIKIILVGGYSRTTILLSKYINALLFILLYYCALILPGTITTLLTSDINNSIYYVFSTEGGIYTHVNFFKYITFIIFSNLLFIIILTTLSFTLSTLTRSASLSLLITISILFFGDTIVSNLNKYTSLAKYLPMANWDLKVYAPGATLPIEGMHFYVSLIINVITIGILLLLSIVYFEKKDV